MTNEEKKKLYDEYRRLFGEDPCCVCVSSESCKFFPTFDGICYEFQIDWERGDWACVQEDIEYFKEKIGAKQEEERKKIRKEWQKKRGLVRRRRSLARSFARAFARELERVRSKEIEKIFNNILLNNERKEGKHD